MSLASDLPATVTDGPLLAAVLVALLAGLVSFASPCVLPLVPGYLSYVTGLTGASTSQESATGGRARWRVPFGALLFVAGFTAVFTVVGATIGGAGTWLLIHAPALERVVGAAIVVLGIGYLGLVPWLQRERRLRLLPASGLLGAPLMGAVFALGWVPCVSPTLAAVQGLAFVEGSAGRGVVLSIAYALGLGVPFVLVALGFSWFARAVFFMRANARWVTRVGGVLLIAVGLALLTGVWGEAMIWLRTLVGPGEIGL